MRGASRYRSFTAFKSLRWCLESIKRESRISAALIEPLQSDINVKWTQKLRFPFACFVCGYLLPPFSPAPLQPLHHPLHSSGYSRLHARKLVYGRTFCSYFLTSFKRPRGMGLLGYTFLYVFIPGYDI